MLLSIAGFLWECNAASLPAFSGPNGGESERLQSSRPTPTGSSIPPQVAAWYNERHTVDDLLDFDRIRMANAEAIGRSERTPSLGSTRDWQHWADFGSVARQDDGRPDGGDVLELLVRTSSESKPEILSQLGREMVASARAELEGAALSDVDPPTWVQEIMSEAGWKHYRQLRRSRQRK